MTTKSEVVLVDFSDLPVGEWSHLTVSFEPGKPVRRWLWGRPIEETDDGEDDDYDE